MDEPPELQYNGHWRMAVWALRVGYVGLAVAIAGLVVMSLGSTPWVLAVGVIIWLAAAAGTLAGRQSPVLSTRPGCASTERVRRVPHMAGWWHGPSHPTPSVLVTRERA